MKKAALFSNFGSWEEDMIGFIGFVDIDPNNDIQSELNRIAHEHAVIHVHENDLNEVFTRSTMPDLPAFGTLLNELQMDFISEHVFTHVIVVDWTSYTKMIVGIIIVD